MNDHKQSMTPGAMPLALALDVGTTSTAAAAVDHQGCLVSVVRKAHRADLTGLPPGHTEQSPRQHWQVTRDVLRELSAQLTEDPVCLGVTGQMHSLLLTDEQRRPLSNLITWQDRRANESFRGSSRTCLEEYLARCDQSVMANTGCRPSPGYAAVSAFVLQATGQLPTETRHLSLLADWIAAELTDGEIVTDRSNAASTGVYDLRRDQWSAELIDAGNLDRHWFPDVVDSGTVCGRLRESVSTSTGLPAGLPVVTPVGDNQASVLGSVPQGEPAIQITIGTGGQVNWPVEAFVRVDGMDTRPLPHGRMMLVGAGLAGGDAFAWSNRTIRQWISVFGINRSEEGVYDTLTRLAGETPPGSDGLHCEPYFRGTRREPLRRATFDGIGSDNFSPGHVARAILEGIADGLHSVWASAGEGHRPNVARIIGCGNGVEQNHLLAEIISDRFALPVLSPQHTEAAAYGAALLAGVGVGFWDHLEDAGAGIVLRTVAPADP